MKKRSAWFAAWFAVLIIGVVAMMAVAPMGKAAEQKQFIVGFDAEFPPYGYMDDNGAVSYTHLYVASSRLCSK